MSWQIVRSVSWLVVCCVMLFNAFEAVAQRSTKREMSHKGITPQALGEKAIEHYKAYELKEARASLEALIRIYRSKRESLPSDWQELSDRIALAERLLPRTELKAPTLVQTVPMAGLLEAVQQYVPGVARAIRPRYERGKLVGIDYVSPITGMGVLSGLVKNGDAVHNYDLIQLETTETRDNTIEELMFPQYINSLEDENFAYILPDGVSLVFGRKSSNGLGGYDLYLGRYHNGRQVYLEPTHLGMPYNSPFNDYLLAYDDDADRSILISDRMCSPDSLRIYVWDGSIKAFGTSTVAESDVERAELDVVKHALLQLPDYIGAMSSSDWSVDTNTDNYRSTYGFSLPITAEGKALAIDALHLSNLLTTKRQEQKRMRQSYRQNKISREELKSQLLGLEDEIINLLVKYKALSKRIRILEAQTTKRM